MKRPLSVLVIFSSVWLIAFAAFATRIGFACYQQTRIPHSVLATVTFDQETGNIALALAHGHGFANLFRKETGPTAWLAPAYPFLVSVIFRFFGPLTLSSFYVAVLLNAVFSAAAAFPLYELARRTAGIPAAVAASWLWAFLPSGVLMPFEWIWDTSLSVLLALLLAWATLRIAERSTWKLWFGYGVLGAVALLSNPALGIALPFLLAWAVVRSEAKSVHSFTQTVVCLVVMVACCLPWTLRNFHHFHRFIPIRSSLPFELWIGNNGIFDEHAVRGIQRITRYEETRRYAQLGETAYLDEKWQLAATFIRTKPALFARLSARRIVATWFGTEHPYDDFRRTDSLLVRSILIVNLFLTIGTVSGALMLLFRKHPLAVPLLVFPLLYPVVYYVTHTSLRYRHPVDPFLLLLTVVAALQLPAVFRPRVQPAISLC